MATIKKQQAIDRLIQAITHAPPDDLAEIYNELFPQAPATEVEVRKGSSPFVAKILAHIDNGLEVEEILDLWNVIFPTHHGVWFDEDDNLIHYEEKIEHVGQAD